MCKQINTYFFLGDTFALNSRKSTKQENNPLQTGNNFAQVLAGAINQIQPAVQTGNSLVKGNASTIERAKSTGTRKVESTNASGFLF